MSDDDSIESEGSAGPLSSGASASDNLKPTGQTEEAVEGYLDDNPSQVTQPELNISEASQEVLDSSVPLTMQGSARM